MDTPYVSLTEKHNAMISYCFLAPFMLISQQSQFKNTFVRSHARYASVLHLAFIFLIITLIRSRNFSTVIIYDLTWVHGVLFVLFFGLLLLLGNGIFSALKWLKPRISLAEFSFKSLEKELTTEVAVSEDEKTPIILSHIPFLGTYLSAKYGGKLYQGEKFGIWLTISWILGALIDPSLTLLITIIVWAIFWIVYQAVGTANTSTVHLIGDRMLGGRDIHVYLRSITTYTGKMFQNGQKIPSWTEIYESTRNSYSGELKNNSSPLIYIPLVNIPFIIKERNKADIQIHVLQGSIITMGFVYALIAWSTSIWILFTLAGFWGYVQSMYNKNCSIPLLEETANMILFLLKWREEKSKLKEIHITTENK